jgi:hypothetical protein
MTATKFFRNVKDLKYSKLPIIQYVWGMECVCYINLPVASGKLLQIPNTKPNPHVFALVLLWESS